MKPENTTSDQTRLDEVLDMLPEWQIDRMLKDVSAKLMIRRDFQLYLMLTDMRREIASGAEHVEA
jgi:hypothetical protein